jgi:acyl dehydratase
MGALQDLAGRVYGPFELTASSERVSLFVDAVGEDPERWAEHVPPMFANVALFTAAPAFLGDGEVVPYTRSLIHSDQAYTWEGPLAVGDSLEVSGTLDSVRVRGDLNLVRFETRAVSSSGPWLEGSSVFVMSQTAAAEAAERIEREATPNHTGFEPVAPPAPGEPPHLLACGATHADLLRYAEASGDSNPIHLDHDAARSAGLGGVVVHGLLMASWLASAVARYNPGPNPLRSLRLRFSQPLHPGEQASISVAAGSEAGHFDVSLTASEERLVSGRIEVTG